MMSGTHPITAEFLAEDLKEIKRLLPPDTSADEGLAQVLREALTVYRRDEAAWQAVEHQHNAAGEGAQVELKRRETSGLLVSMRSRTIRSEMEMFLVHDLLHDEEIREKFQEGFGLCLPHFRVTLRMVASEEERQLLVDVEAQKFEALAAQLGTYTRKLSWDHRHEPMGREVSSPVRVIEQFVGKKA